jgi:hypothetical protein
MKIREISNKQTFQTNVKNQVKLQVFLTRSDFATVSTDI